MIGLESIASAEALAPDRLLDLVSVAEPGNASPVNREPLVELLQIPVREILHIDVLVLQQHGLGVSLLGMLEELLVFQTHAYLRVVINLGSLHSVI